MFAILVRCYFSTSTCCVFYLQGNLSEEDWAKLEDAATYAKVTKVKVDVYSDRGSRVLAAGFSKNTVLKEVELGGVPKELVESVRGTLSKSTALTVTIW